MRVGCWVLRSQCGRKARRARRRRAAVAAMTPMAHRPSVRISLSSARPRRATRPDVHPVSRLLHARWHARAGSAARRVGGVGCAPVRADGWVAGLYVECSAWPPQRCLARSRGGAFPPTYSRRMASAPAEWAVPPSRPRQGPERRTQGRVGGGPRCELVRKCAEASGGIASRAATPP